jgi:hypothetical protein
MCMSISVFLTNLPSHLQEYDINLSFLLQNEHLCLSIIYVLNKSYLNIQIYLRSYLLFIYNVM